RVHNFSRCHLCIAAPRFDFGLRNPVPDRAIQPAFHAALHDHFRLAWNNLAPYTLVVGAVPAASDRPCPRADHTLQRSVSDTSRHIATRVQERAVPQNAEASAGGSAWNSRSD